MPTYLLDARTAGPHFPGIGRYVRNLAAALVPLLSAGERLVLLTDPRHPFTVQGVDVLPVPAAPFSLAQQWTMPPAIRRAAASLYHSPYYLMPYLPGALTVLTVYDLIPLRHPEHSTARARLLFRLATRLALRAASHVIAITESARGDFIAAFGLSPQRITAIPLAADTAFRPGSNAAIAAVRAKYGLPERFALYVGSNKPHKNLVGLVRAWRVTPKAGASLVVAGAWDERYPEARQLAESVGDESILWIGPVPEEDLSALYSAAEVFVFPSLFEGFGLPVVEAMACGAPVICSHAPALAEVAGDAALLFDPRDTGSMAGGLERALTDKGLRRTLVEKGLQRAREFSWERTAAETLGVYRKVLDVEKRK